MSAIQIVRAINLAEYLVTRTRPIAVRDVASFLADGAPLEPRLVTARRTTKILEELGLLMRLQSEEKNSRREATRFVVDKAYISTLLAGKSGRMKFVSSAQAASSEIGRSLTTLGWLVRRGAHGFSAQEFASALSSTGLAGNDRLQRATRILRALFDDGAIGVAGRHCSLTGRAPCFRMTEKYLARVSPRYIPAAAANINDPSEDHDADERRSGGSQISILPGAAC
jgi:hypothetical protein